MSERYFDDFRVGEKFETRGITVTDGDIIGFALRFDPQPFHLDVNAAADSPYGGLIASGFHTMALCFRMFIQENLLTACSMGSPGIDEVRWLGPVRPGDTLRTEVEVVEVKPSSSKPDRGIAKMRYSAINQHGETVLAMTLIHILKRKTQ